MIAPAVEYVNGFDLETKSATNRAAIIQIGSVVISVRTLQAVSTLNLGILSDDLLQADLCRESSAQTIEWWENVDNSKFGPCPIAKKAAWNGTLTTEQAMDALDAHLRECAKFNVGISHNMRGPEFDYTIIKSLYDDVGARLNIKFSQLDSDRTIERVSNGLGIPAITENEYRHISPSDNWIPHIAVCDAAKEAYHAARLYHVLWWISNHGYDKAMEVVRGWAEGKFEVIPSE